MTAAPLSAVPAGAAWPAPRPRVILLAGFPNSGTTIANYILGQHPEVFAPGELYGFPHRQLKPGKRCACGVAASDCPFWRGVLAALGPLAAAPPAERMPALYAVLARLSGRPWIVDVAHDLHAVQAARDLSGIDLTLVHLTRRRLAVLRSRLALNRRQGDVEPYTLAYLHQAVRHTRRLITHRRALDRCVRMDGAAAIHVAYEQLCERPRSALARVGAAAGLDFTAVAGQLEAGAPLVPPAHLIRGNARLRGDAVVQVAKR